MIATRTGVVVFVVLVVLVVVLVVPHDCDEDPGYGLTYFEAASKGKKACEGDWRGEGLEIWRDEVSSGSTLHALIPIQSWRSLQCFGRGLGETRGAGALLESRP